MNVTKFDEEQQRRAQREAKHIADNYRALEARERILKERRAELGEKARRLRMICAHRLPNGESAWSVPPPQTFCEINCSICGAVLRGHVWVHPD